MKANGTTRREFIFLASTAAAGFAASGALADTIVVAGTQQGAMPILSVGYWDGGFRSDGQPSGRLINAEGGAGDSRFSRAAALVSVLGFWRSPKNRSEAISLSLFPMFPVIDPATSKKTPLVAWNASMNDRGRVSGNGRSTFTVPIDAANGLEVAVERVSSSKARRRAASAASAGAEDGLKTMRATTSDPSSVLRFGIKDAPIALNRGVYFVALRDTDRQELPDWSRLHVSGITNSIGRVHPTSEGILTADGRDGITFDYIVISIEPYGVSS